MFVTPKIVSGRKVAAGKKVFSSNLYLINDVFFRGDAFAYLAVMVACGALIFWAPNHGVCSLCDVAFFAQVRVLPLDEFLVSRPQQL